ncbi:hypothetical protein [Candidatus Cyanaurora vandensis]|uniref:hypothetical protein n=1 Tax=Candidatus Cyanaurora vandensis TaxID=2714958 RepID=UPI00257E0068|nr:hypothetical protein [Candidatus Cyanaurora vandensis]
MGKNTWIGIVIIGIAATLLMLFGWPFFIQAIRVIRPTVSFNIWLESFRYFGLVSLSVSLLLSIVWWGYGIVNPEPTPGLWWGLLVVAILAAVVPGFFYLAQAANREVALGIYLLNNVGLAYWLATVFFSPPNSKFVPPGALQLRGDW